MISGNYVEIRPQDIGVASVAFAEAWKDQRLPVRQYLMSTVPEMQRFREGYVVKPFMSAIAALNDLSTGHRLLDVGCASGFYREVFQLAHLPFDYTGVDVSEALVKFGRDIYSGIRLDVGDVRALPYATASFDVVFSSGCIMHVFEYAQAIREMMRVANRYVVLNKTPIEPTGITRMWKKEAYGVACLEIHFSEQELLTLFHDVGLYLIGFVDDGDHKTFVLEKTVPEPYASDPNV